MFVLVTEEGGAQQRLEFSKPEITVGRVQGNDIILSKRNVSKKHAQITLDRERPVVADLGSTNGTWVNGHRISAPVALKAGDKIYIADFILTLETRVQRGKSSRPGPSMPPPPPPSAQSARVKQPEPTGSSNLSVSPHAETPGPADSALPTDAPEKAEPITEPPASEEASKTEAPGPKPSQAAEAPASRNEARTSATEAPRPNRTPAEELRARLAESFEVQNSDAAAMGDEQRWSDAQAAISKALKAMKTEGLLDEQADTTALADTTLHEIVGLGLLDDLFSSEGVREILVRGTDAVLVDRGKGLEPTDQRFSSDEALRTVAARLASQTGGSLQEQSSFTGQLSFGPLVSILQSPIALRGPVIEVRMNQRVTLSGLAEQGWLSPAMADYLGKAVVGRRNIIVTGAQGAGVTTLVSALANELSPSARTVVVEALPDLKIDRKNVVSLTSLHTNLGLSEVIGRAGRMRAEHLVLDDVSSRDAWSALSTLAEREPGHIVGLHAWRAQDAVSAVMQAARCSGAPIASTAELVASAVDLVVAVTRTPGAPRVNTVFQVSGTEAGALQHAAVEID